ncbi:hypothetical protein C8J57DRAFT_1292669 [Mycena rebaudengoi]|nr:hypothetical protein C8J57DRAFT_1292669 [Mycena rebaudengoi]
MPVATWYVPTSGSSAGSSPYAGPSNASPYSSPTYPMSSFSPGPLSPPPLNYSRYAPLPALNGHIHDVFRDPSRHMLSFDVSCDPTYALSSLPPPVRVQAATSPCLPCVSITCDLFPGSIDIHPSSSKPGAFVTVADVIQGIIRGLREAVSREEIAMAAHVHDMPRVHKAFTRRCRRLGQQDHLRRIDFLMGAHRFVGLLSTSQNPDVWKLALSL